MKITTTVLFPAAVLTLWTVLIPARTIYGQNDRLELNSKDYFETRGLTVHVFENQFNGMFFDEKTAGILLVHHDERTATGGAVRLKPTPEQWDQIPTVVERTVNRDDNSIEVVLRYTDFGFDSRIRVRPQGTGIRMTVSLDKPLPEILQGRAGFNLEFLPTAYFEKMFIMDGKTGVFPHHPSGPVQVRPADTQIRQFAGHATFDDRGLSEYVEPLPIAAGKSLTLAPECPKRRIHIRSMPGDLMLLDGRNVAQNGWFVVRSLLPSEKTGEVLEWLVTPNIIPGWTRPPIIAYSQAGYTPAQKKIAVIELDRNDKIQDSAVLLQLKPDGGWTEKYQGKVQEWGPFLRYNYAKFDFSAVQASGLYAIRYAGRTTGTFPVDPSVYDNIWQPTLDVWFPVQMDHMFVNEAYRVWHGAAHLDDARQAPVNHQHFDGYSMKDSTYTAYKPGERVPGLNTGGWFDAGDFDIRTGSHCNTVLHLVTCRELFNILRDQTMVLPDQRYVDIHHPDGKPDILQQIEHGALALIAQHRAFGRAVPGIIVPNLHQYHHLGDGSTMTDNLIYNPALKPYESNGRSSGTPDDRWVFTTPSSRLNYSSMTALAAAGRALAGYNETLAHECLAAAQKAWDNEHRMTDTAPQRGFMFGSGDEIQAALQLYISTKDTRFADRFLELIWPSLEKHIYRHIRHALLAVPHMDTSFKEKLRPFVQKFKSALESISGQNPFGVPITTGGWAGNSTIIDGAVTAYLAHKIFPDLIGPDYTLRSMDYIFGCHPVSNISFVSGVGRYSKTKAYGGNRADYSYIAGGVVPGVLVLKPDLPENMIDWPFLWGENEYVIDISAHYILLANAAADLVRE